MRKIEDIQQLMHSLCRVLEKYTTVSKVQKNFGLEDPLYPAEIHVLSSIATMESSSVTDIAKQFGTTKGAASQLAGKLASKGYVLKNTDPEKGSRLLLTPTMKGLEAHNRHLEYHKKKDKIFFEYLSSLTDEQYKTFEEICRQMNLWMDSYLE